MASEKFLPLQIKIRRVWPRFLLTQFHFLFENHVSTSTLNSQLRLHSAACIAVR